MGGIVIGYEIGKVLNVETIFAERVDGKFHLRRGFEIKKNQKSITLRRRNNNGQVNKRMCKIGTRL